MIKINGIYVRNDLTGRQFGKLTAVRPAHRQPLERSKWECLCECGNTAKVDTNKLTSGHTKSCGCNRILADLEGERFGRLVAIRPLSKRVDNRVVWLSQCDCGEFAETPASLLVSGTTQSCGCLAKELSSQRKTTHGMSQSPEYSSWRSMRKRCTDPNHVAFSSYGGRGIKVCPEWLKSFETFFCDMGPLPGLNFSIDRRDNDGDYTPTNCRWADKSTQQLNRGVSCNSKTGVTGVIPRGDKWLASLAFRGKVLLYQTFENFDDAVKARDEAKDKVNCQIEDEENGALHSSDVSLETVEGKTD